MIVRRWLKGWYFLLIALLVEITAYFLSGYIAGRYHTMVWDSFNRGVKEMREIDRKTPYADYINRFSREAGISPEIVAGVIQAESSFQPRALSKSGAYGLMQIMPDTWRQVNKDLKVCNGRHAGECTVECYYNPELNTRIGTAYLAQLNRQFSGDMVLALAAYNAGPGAVKQYGGVPPYSETTTYVSRVIDYWYKIASKVLPDYSRAAGHWDTIHNCLGWFIMLTVGLIVLIGRRLYRVSRSWRWR